MTEDTGENISLQVASVVATQQRAIQLLRNELAVEMWLSQENSKHIRRLHQDRILSKNVEMER